MKKLMVLSILISFILLIGCGSGGDNNKPKKQTIDEVLKVGDIVYNAPQNIDFNNKTGRLGLKRIKKMLNKSTLAFQKMATQNQKARTFSCSVSGVYDSEENDDGSQSIFYNECVEYNKNTELNEYYHGMVSIASDKEHFRLYNYSEIPDYNNFERGTYYEDMRLYIHSENGIDEVNIEGTMKDYINGYVSETMTYSNMTIKNNTLTKSWYFKGGFYDKVENSCFAENHIYDTDNNNWLIESSLNNNYWSSGTLYVDSIKYVYSGDSVTVTKGDISGTFTQQELLDELAKERNSTDCNI
jgi:hypothetical protein